LHTMHTKAHNNIIHASTSTISPSNKSFYVYLNNITMTTCFGPSVG
jgi:hypothetical protein